MIIYRAHNGGTKRKREVKATVMMVEGKEER
jgi:hypothetical protein